MSEGLTEIDVARNFDSSAPQATVTTDDGQEYAAEAPTIDPSAEPAVSYDPADPASVDRYIAAQRDEWIQSGATAWAEQVQQQQAAEAARQQQIAEWLGDPWSEGYEERLAELQVQQAVEARVAELNERYRPTLEYAEQQEAARQEALAQEQLEASVVQAADILSEEAEQLGAKFSYEEAWNTAERMVEGQLGRFVSQGVPYEQAVAFLEQNNFAEAALRAAARMLAGDGKTAADGNAPQAVEPARTFEPSELSIARHWTPRSPGEAVRQADERETLARTPNPRTGLIAPDVHRAPTSELDAARLFLDRNQRR